MIQTRRPRAACAWALVALLTPAAGAAQAVALDAGRFRISVAGQEIGADSFDIRSTGSGAQTRVFAQGWIELEGHRLNTILEVDGAGAFTAYQVEDAGAEVAETRVRLGGGRLELSVLSAAGERTRELRAADGMVVLEAGVAHHHHFLAAHAVAGGAIPLLVPTRSGQATAEVRSRTPERVRVGGQELEATRLVFAVGTEERWVWVDASGRVLRVEVPSSGWLAERARPPS